MPGKENNGATGNCLLKPRATVSRLATTQCHRDDSTARNPRRVRQPAAGAKKRSGLDRAPSTACVKKARTVGPSRPLRAAAASQGNVAGKRVVRGVKGHLTMSEARSRIKDLKARVRDLRATNEELQSAADESQRQQGQYLEELSTLREDLQKAGTALRECTSRLQVARENHKVEREQREIAEHARESAQGQVDAMRRALAVKDEQLASRQEELDITRAKLTVLEDTERKQSHQLAQLCCDHERLQKKAQSLESEHQRLEPLCREQDAIIAGYKRDTDVLQAKIGDLEDKARMDEVVRKRLHNTIQELKGNVRVFCRVRPLLEPEMQHKAVFEFETSQVDRHTIHLLPPDAPRGYLSQSRAERRHSFTFDRVFCPEHSQQDVFDEISQLVQSAMDGYKVCIFAYGQTGSGKTFTMEGPSLSEHDPQRGMIPRAMEQIFSHGADLESKGWAYEFHLSVLEIYMEKIRDLLRRGGQQLELAQRNRSQRDKVEVVGLSSVPVTCAADVYPLLRKASEHRRVGKTDCNERSSRSHSVFQLTLVGRNTVTGQKVDGALNLIDLAGSERLKKSHAQGVHLKETQHINQSLSCLGNVIGAIANKARHVPYRNSKLTHLLMNHIGGDSKTLMFLNLCPEPDKSDESMCSLRFATKVHNCEIGVARRSATMDSA